MCIECHIMHLVRMDQIIRARLFLHIHTIDQNKGIMIYGVDLPDVILNTDFSCDDLYIVPFLNAGTYIDAYSVILSEKVAYTDEEDLPVLF